MQKNLWQNSTQIYDQNSLKVNTEGTYLNIIRPYKINPEQTLFSLMKNWKDAL